MWDVTTEGTRPTVLLVEDDWDVSEAVGGVLREEGYDVVFASDGREALEKLRAGPLPSAVVLDLFLPEVNGWDLYRTLKSDPRLSHLPVIVMTAAGEYWGYPVPEAMVVRKPVDAVRLVRLLGAATGRESSTRH
jgi:CheY-like chemotaxis protein